MLKRLKFLTLGLALVLPLAACDDDEPPPIVDPVQEIGNISGAALIEGAALPGATIAIAGPQASTAVTDAGGAYAFTGVPVGAYTVTISGSASDITFATTTVSVTVTNAGTATADFAGTYIRTAALAIGVTVDTGDGPEGVPNVPITITGTESFANQTDETGQRTFTGLRKGSYTVEIDVSGLPEQVVISTSQTATLDVGQTIALTFAGAIAQEPTISISSMMQVTGGGAGLPVNPAAVLGTIALTINHDAGDDQATRLSLLLNDVEVDFQTFSATPVAGLEGPARTPGDPVTFTVNTAGFDTGTFAVDFPNGDYEVKAQLTLASGKVVTATAGTPLTFANLDVLTVRHTSGGQGIVRGGVRFWGGESINFDAVAIIYSTTVQIAQIGVTASQPVAGAGSTANAGFGPLDLGSGPGVESVTTAPPFVYAATVTDNTQGPEDLLPAVLGPIVPGGSRGQTLTITSVLDPAGVNILPDFAPGTNTPLQDFMTDFVAPLTNVGGATTIGVTATDIPALSAETGVEEWYSAGNYALLPASSVTELGVGGINTTFDVDDNGTTADPDFSSIVAVTELPENDNGPGTGFDAELVGLEDDLGNANPLTLGQIIDVANRSDEHGTDFTAPVVTNILPDPAVAIILNPDDDGPADGSGPDDGATSDNIITYDTDDPELGDGSLGSGMFSTDHTFVMLDPDLDPPTVLPTITAVPATGPATVLGAPTIDYEICLGAGTGAPCSFTGGVQDAQYTVTATIPDKAIPGNVTTIVWDITIDGTDPTTNMVSPPPGTLVTTNTKLTIPISGSADDANGLSEVFVRVRDADSAGGATLGVCELADDLWTEGGAAGEVDVNEIDVTANATGFTVNIVLNNPGVTQLDNVCFFIESEDNAKDNTGELEPNRSDESALTAISWN